MPFLGWVGLKSWNGPIKSVKFETIKSSVEHKNQDFTLSGEPPYA